MQEMMMRTDPITPPDKQLVRKWIEDWAGGQMKGPVTEDQLVVATQAAQWGADQELEACCEWLDTEKILTKDGGYIRKLRIARRPKPPSLKAQALAVITNAAICDHLSPEDEAILRRALEALDD
jgi:hypothetical protein